MIKDNKVFVQKGESRLRKEKKKEMKKFSCTGTAHYSRIELSMTMGLISIDLKC